eukprot:TRINITY_DN2759_c0_g1_i4.p1 TRINITY_DN2759_c0_g1~~TRINITY_DN2759_c0_g1_i4.p1  ORF type:complete len:263 (-),score=38.97 TRINITY_DN2759_c0_g1_i4:89-877(-)
MVVEVRRPSLIYNAAGGSAPPDIGGQTGGDTGGGGGVGAGTDGEDAHGADVGGSGGDGNEVDAANPSGGGPQEEGEGGGCEDGGQGASGGIDDSVGHGGERDGAARRRGAGGCGSRAADDTAGDAGGADAGGGTGGGSGQQSTSAGARIPDASRAAGEIVGGAARAGPDAQGSGIGGLGGASPHGGSAHRRDGRAYGGHSARGLPADSTLQVSQGLPPLPESFANILSFVRATDPNVCQNLKRDLTALAWPRNQERRARGDY